MHSINKRYSIIKELGSSDFAITYLVKDSVDNILYVLKLENVYGKPFTKSNQVRRQYEVMLTLQHPFVVKPLRLEKVKYIDDDPIEEELLFYIMYYYEKAMHINEYLENQLNTLYIDIYSILLLFYKIVSSIHYIHVTGLTHNDITVKNILVYNNNPIILDLYPFEFRKNVFEKDYDDIISIFVRYLQSTVINTETQRIMDDIIHLKIVRYNFEIYTQYISGKYGFKPYQFYLRQKNYISSRNLNLFEKFKIIQQSPSRLNFIVLFETDFRNLLLQEYVNYHKSINIHTYHLAEKSKRSSLEALLYEMDDHGLVNPRLKEDLFTAIKHKKKQTELINIIYTALIQATQKIGEVAIIISDLNQQDRIVKLLMKKIIQSNDTLVKVFIFYNRYLHLSKSWTIFSLEIKYSNIKFFYSIIFSKFHLPNKLSESLFTFIPDQNTFSMIKTLLDNSIIIGNYIKMDAKLISVFIKQFYDYYSKKYMLNSLTFIEQSLLYLINLSYGSLNINIFEGANYIQSFSVLYRKGLINIVDSDHVTLSSLFIGNIINKMFSFRHKKRFTRYLIPLIQTHENSFETYTIIMSVNNIMGLKKEYEQQIKKLFKNYSIYTYYYKNPQHYNYFVNNKSLYLEEDALMLIYLDLIQFFTVRMDDTVLLHLKGHIIRSNIKFSTELASLCEKQYYDENKAKLLVKDIWTDNDKLPIEIRSSLMIEEINIGRLVNNYLEVEDFIQSVNKYIPFFSQIQVMMYIFFLAQCYFDTYSKNNNVEYFDKFSTLINFLYNDSSELGYYDFTTKLLMYKGIIYELNNDIDQALIYYKDASKRADKISAHTLRVYSNCHIASIYAEKIGDIKTAIHYYEEAYFYVRKSYRSSEMYFYIIYSLLKVYATSGQFDKIIAIVKQKNQIMPSFIPIKTYQQFLLIQFIIICFLNKKRAVGLLDKITNLYYKKIGYLIIVLLDSDIEKAQQLCREILEKDFDRSLADEGNRLFAIASYLAIVNYHLSNDRNFLAEWYKFYKSTASSNMQDHPLALYLKALIENRNMDENFEALYNSGMNENNIFIQILLYYIGFSLLRSAELYFRIRGLIHKIESNLPHDFKNSLQSIVIYNKIKDVKYAEEKDSLKSIDTLYHNLLKSFSLKPEFVEILIEKIFLQKNYQFIDKIKLLCRMIKLYGFIDYLAFYDFSTGFNWNKVFSLSSPHFKYQEDFFNSLLNSFFQTGNAVIFKDFSLFFGTPKFATIIPLRSLDTDVRRKSSSSQQSLDTVNYFIYLESHQMITPYYTLEDSYIFIFSHILSLYNQYFENLQKYSYCPLTGALMRDEFLKRSNRILSWNKKGYVFFIDIDNFKLINDQFNHHYGDIVLAKVVGIIKSVLRKNDLVGRYGGEEFVVILPDIEEHNAVTVANRILTKIRASHIIEAVRITVTIGISQYPKDGIIIETLIEKADSATLFGKRKGKNTIVMYQKGLDKEYREQASTFGIIVRDPIKTNDNIKAVLKLFEINKTENNGERLNQFIDLLHSIISFDAYEFLLNKKIIALSHESSLYSNIAKKNTNIGIFDSSSENKHHFMIMRSNDKVLLLYNSKQFYYNDEHFSLISKLLSLFRYEEEVKKV